MKVLLDYCRQPRAYADSEGHCVIELEEGDDVEEIKCAYQRPKEWYMQKYFAPRQSNTFTHNDKVFKGNLLIFNTRREFLD